MAKRKQINRRRRVVNAKKQHIVAPQQSVDLTAKRLRHRFRHRISPRHLLKCVNRREQIVQPRIDAR